MFKEMKELKLKRSKTKKIVGMITLNQVIKKAYSNFLEQKVK